MSTTSRCLSCFTVTAAIIGLSVGGTLYKPSGISAASAINTPLVQTLSVKTSGGTFTVKAVSFDRRGMWKIMTDTANDGRACGKKCNVKSVSAFVQQRHAVAGINGTYFNKNVFQYVIYNSFTKKVANKDNINNLPASLLAVDTKNNPYLYLGTSHFSTYQDFLDTFLFESQADGSTGQLRALISNHPTWVYPGMQSLDFNWMDGMIPLNSKTTRSGIGWNAKRWYLFVVQKASMVDASRVAKAMKLEYALGMDGGGSSSLFANGKYVVGPGRAVPNAILVTR